MINLEYEIRKIYLICNIILQISEHELKDKKYDHFTVLDILKEKYQIKVDIQYLDFIIEVLRYFFKFVVPVKERKIEKFMDLI